MPGTIGYTYICPIWWGVIALMPSEWTRKIMFLIALVPFLPCSYRQLWVGSWTRLSATIHSKAYQGPCCCCICHTVCTCSMQTILGEPLATPTIACPLLSSNSANSRLNSICAYSLAPTGNHRLQVELGSDCTTCCCNSFWSKAFITLCVWNHWLHPNLFLRLYIEYTSCLLPFSCVHLQESLYQIPLGV